MVIQKEHKKKRNVAIYGRVSTESVQQLSAMENQKDFYEKKAIDNPSWNIVKRYYDTGLTGVRVTKRTEFNKMIEDAKAGVFDLIVTREVSRFARNTLDTFQYTELLTDLGVEVYFINEDLSTADSSKKVVFSMMASLAEEESRKISERVKLGQSSSRFTKQSVYGNGNTLGYDREPHTKKVILNKKQAETVKYIFNKYLVGESTTEIRDLLMANQYLNSSGVVNWTTTTVARVLKNSLYSGIQNQNKSNIADFKKGTRTYNDKSEYLPIEVDVIPIISKEDYCKVQEIMKSRTYRSEDGKVNGLKVSKDKWVGILECNCGSTLRVNKKYTNKHGQIEASYKCLNGVNNSKSRKNRLTESDLVCKSKAIGQWRLEFLVKVILREIWTEKKEDIIKVYEVIKENLVMDLDYVREAYNLNKEMNKLQTKNKLLLDLYLDEAIERNDYLVRKQELDSLIRKLQHELEEIEGLINRGESKTGETLTKIKESLDKVIDFDKEKLDEGLIKLLIDRIIVREDNKFEVFLNLSMQVDKSDFTLTKGLSYEMKKKKSENIRNNKYIELYTESIPLDEALRERKKYKKEIKSNKWNDITYSVYLR